MKKIVSCLLAMLGIGTACTTAHDVEVNEFADLIKQDDVELLDVRTPDEYAQGHLAGALNVDVNLDNFADSALALLRPNHRVAVYCRSGRRSAKAAELLTQKGLRVINLKGGIEAWKKQGKPVAQPGVAYDTLQTPGGQRVMIFPLMHASLRLRMGDVELYIDPVSELGDRKVDYWHMPAAHLVLVTHEHADHLDETAINDLCYQQGKLITNARCDSLLGGRAQKVMANGDHASQCGIEIDAVPAYNSTPGREKFHPKGRDNGFVLTYDGLRIYVAGDTEDIPEMAALKDIDIAFLPCNQPYTMTVDQLVKAARTIKPKVLYPYHYSQTDISQLPELLKADGIEVRLRAWEQ